MISRIGLFVVNTIVFWVFVSASMNTEALPTYDPQDPVGEEHSCVPNVIANGQPTMVGFPLVGQTMTIKAEHLKLFDIGEFCTG